MNNEDSDDFDKFEREPELLEDCSSADVFRFLDGPSDPDLIHPDRIADDGHERWIPDE